MSGNVRFLMILDLLLVNLFTIYLQFYAFLLTEIDQEFYLFDQINQIKFDQINQIKRFLFPAQIK